MSAKYSVGKYANGEFIMPGDHVSYLGEEHIVYGPSADPEKTYVFITSTTTPTSRFTEGSSLTKLEKKPSPKPQLNIEDVENNQQNIPEPYESDIKWKENGITYQVSTELIDIEKRKYRLTWWGDGNVCFVEPQQLEVSNVSSTLELFQLARTYFVE